MTVSLLTVEIRGRDPRRRSAGDSLDFTDFRVALVVEADNRRLRETATVGGAQLLVRVQQEGASQAIEGALCWEIVTLPAPRICGGGIEVAPLP